MFTGIITAIGEIRRVEPVDGGREFDIAAPWTDLVLGESVAVDGACLTVAATGDGWFRVHAIATTLDRTTFGAHAPGRRVNLERALAVGDRLGGHLVQGHVDGIGTVLRTARRDDAWLVDLAVPAAIEEVSVPLGSITVDGVSLTVNAMPAPGTIQVSLIPFTLEHTTLGDRRAGDRVHLEGDVIGKYVRALVAPHRARRQEGA